MEPDIPQLASHLRSQVAALTRRLRQQAQLDSMPFSQLVALSAIDRLGGAVSPSDLAAAELLRSSNLAALLRELEAQGHIERRADPNDGRKTRVSLTASGKRVLYGNRARREHWLVQAMQSCLTADDRALLVRAGALLERLAQHGEPSRAASSTTSSRKKSR